MGLHHKLCHTLGGSFNLPHAEVHTVVLPHALAYNAAARPRRWRASRRGARQPAVRRTRQARSSISRATRRARRAARHRHAAPTDLDRAADLAVQNH